MTLDILTVGDSVIDKIVRIPRFLRGNEDSVHGQGIKRQLGGSSNFLIMSSRLGLRVGIIDYIGNDDDGVFYKDGLKSEGVDVSHLRKVDEFATSSCLVMQTERGKHAYVGFKGASGQLGPEEIDESIILNTKAFYGSGYALASKPIELANLKAMSLAFENNIRIFFDPSPIVKMIPTKSLREAISLSNVILLNDREILLLKNSLEFATIDELIDVGPEIIVVKKGGKGCSVYTTFGADDYEGHPREVIDTTGAGDSFNAAFVYGLLNKWSISESVKLANVVGAVKVTKNGAGKQVPTVDEIRIFIKENGVEFKEKI